MKQLIQVLCALALLSAVLLRVSPQAAAQPWRGVADVLTARTGSPPREGNAYTLLPDGGQMVDSLLCDIARARESIDLEYFWFEADSVGRRFREALIARAREGVPVRMLIDNILLPAMPRSFFTPMEQAGVELRYFVDYRQPLIPLLGEVAHRDHRKLAILDGKHVYVGGMNITHLTYSFTDLHLRLEGPVVAAFADLFEQEWAGHGGTPRPVPAPGAPCGSVIAQAAPGYPGEDSPLLGAFYQMIDQAKTYLWIQSPYLNFPPELMEHLKGAASRGVDVRIVTPHHKDLLLVASLCRSYYPEMLSAGIRVFEFGEGFSHTKVVVSDDVVATVGSLNLNYRSLEADYECNVFLYGEESVSPVKDYFQEYLNRCDEITSFHADPIERLQQRFIRLFRQIA